MRQQYHLKTVGGQRYVWDVNKLVVKAKALPVFNMPLSDIKELDETYWFEEGGWKKPTTRYIALHAKLISECDLKHPIILHSDGRVMDGMHRCCKALIEGRDTIKAVKFEHDPQPDYIDPDWDNLPYEDDFQDTLKKLGLPYKN